MFGLLGFGGIAQKVAKRMLSFGLKVVAYDPYLPDEAFEAAGVTRAATQDEVFAQADILSLNLPLTDETKHVVNRESIRKMKDHVFIINTARGPLIDQKALLEALRSGKVCGAGIDVFEEEPLPADHPLCAMENVIITPHAAYYSKDSLPELEAKSLDEVLRALRGEPARILYNKAALGL